MKENFKKESPILSLPSLGGGANAPSVAGGGPVEPAIGQVEYTSAGTYNWTCPADGSITTVSVVCIGAGGAAQTYGGVGGSLAYKNNITVTPGQTYQIVVGETNTTSSGYGQLANASAGPSSAFGTTATGGHGGYVTSHSAPYSNRKTIGTNYDGGGRGGRGSADYYASGVGYYAGAGGGAGGYSGDGGDGAFGGSSSNPSGSNAQAGSGGGGGGAAHYLATKLGGAGGGTGIYGEGSSGAAGLTSNTQSDSIGHGGSGGTDGMQARAGTGTAATQPYGGNFGGGSGIIYADTSQFPIDTTKQNGAVRFIYPGDVRQFPSTRTADE